VICKVKERLSLMQWRKRDREEEKRERERERERVAKWYPCI
jgi:hypothetical protein